MSCHFRRLDAIDGVYWDGTRADIIVSPRIETVGATTATLRDCQSIGGIVRKLATKEALAGTSEPDIDDSTRLVGAHQRLLGRDSK